MRGTEGTREPEAIVWSRKSPTWRNSRMTMLPMAIRPVSFGDEVGLINWAKIANVGSTGVPVNIEEMKKESRAPKVPTLSSLPVMVRATYLCAMRRTRLYMADALAVGV